MSRHQTAIDNIVAGTEDAPRYLLSWVEAAGSGRLLQCRLPVCSRELARRIVHELFLPDDQVAKINLVPLS